MLVNWPYGFQILMIMVAISVVSLVDYLFHGYERAVPEEDHVPGDAE